MPNWELPATLPETAASASDARMTGPATRVKHEVRSPPRKKRFGEQLTPDVSLELSDQEDQPMRGMMVQQTAYLSQSVREMFAMLLTVVLYPTSLPLAIELKQVGERYAAAVRGKLGTHGFGAPHVQKAF